MAENTRKYLDYQGLKDFWELVKNYYANNGVGTVHIADSAVKLAEARKLTFKSGDQALGEGYFDGSEDVVFNLTLPDTGVLDVKVDGTSVVVGGIAEIDLTPYAKKSDIAKVLEFKGVVATEADLPVAAEAKIGDVYIVKAENAEFVCVEVDEVKKWEKLGPMIDLSGYYTKEEADTAIATAVASEAALREAADTALDGKIDQVSSDLDDEIVRAKAAEEGLQTAIDAKQGKLTAGIGILIDDTNTISVDDATIATVEYVDASITDTMNFIIQERDAEHAGRVAGDNLLNARITTEIENRTKAIDDAFNTELHVITKHDILKLFGDDVTVADTTEFVNNINTVKPGSTVKPETDISLANKVDLMNDVTVDLN